jgi:hypothetical protein
MARQVHRALLAWIGWRLRGGELHVVIAAPMALAVLVGQLLNAWGRSPPSDGPHVYPPSLTIAASVV